MLKSDYICSDETTVNVLQESKSTNYIWVHQSGERHNRIVIYEYNKSRSQDVINEFLLNFRGYHQSDGYVGYAAVHSKDYIIGVGFRVDEDVSILTPHRPGRAQLTHPVLHIIRFAL